jgi:hypothetical protein
MGIPVKETVHDAGSPGFFRGCDLNVFQKIQHQKQYTITNVEIYKIVIPPFSSIMPSAIFQKVILCFRYIWDKNANVANVPDVRLNDFE